MYNVLVTEVSELFGYNNHCLNIEVDPSLATRPDEIVRRAADSHAIVVRNVTKADSFLIRRLRECTPVRVIGRLGVGLDNIDVSAAREAGVQVVYTPDANTESTAQFVLGQILAVTRCLPTAHAGTAEGKWNRLACMGRELSELTVGIVGFGRIGNRLADIMTSFGSTILVSTRRAETVPPAYSSVPLPELFSTADVVSLHVPSTAATRGMIGPEHLRLMRPDAILINTARGDVVDETELHRFLENRPDVTAVLDVRATEPPKDDLFRNLPNVRLAPHVAAFTSAAQRQVLRTVLDDVGRVLAGDHPRFPAP